MNHQDLTAFSRISRALWYNSKDSDYPALETLSIVSSLDLTEDRILEKSLKALLERSKREGSHWALKSESFFHPFFRLSPEQRMILVSLHVGKWSYARLSRVFGLDGEKIQELAWAARIELGGALAYPPAPVTRGIHCPEYDPRKPWTQRFLDAEIDSGADRMFLQSHLLKCASCSQCLIHGRRLYYASEKEVIERTGASLSLEPYQELLRQSVRYKYSSMHEIFESFARFSRRRDVRIALALLIFLGVMKGLGIP